MSEQLTRMLTHKLLNSFLLSLSSGPLPIANECNTIRMVTPLGVARRVGVGDCWLRGDISMSIFSSVKSWVSSCTQAVHKYRHRSILAGWTFSFTHVLHISPLSNLHRPRN